MSLEAAISELVKVNQGILDATLKLVDSTDRLAGLRADAVETVKAAAASETKATKAATPKAAAETKAADPVDEKKAVVEAAMEHPVGKLIMSYVGEGYDAAHPQAADERKARSERIKTLYAKLGDQLKVTITKYNDIPETAHAPVIKKIGELIEAGNLVIKPESAEIDL